MSGTKVRTIRDPLRMYAAALWSYQFSSSRFYECTCHITAIEMQLSGRSVVHEIVSWVRQEINKFGTGV